MSRRQPRVLCLCLFAALALCCIISTSSGEFKTTRKYAHGKIGRPDHVRLTLAYFRETVNKWKATKRSEKGITTADKMPWYINADDARFEDIGKLWVMTFEQEGNARRIKSADCTAFYVAEDVLLTAAHCLTNAKVTAVTAAAGQHLILFYQGYQGVDIKTDEEIKNNLRFGVEYWYPANYDEGDCVFIAGSGNDWVFLRVHAKKSNAGMYTLALSTPFVHETVFGVGYPSDAADVFKPFYAQGKLFRLTEDEFKTNPARERAKMMTEQLADMANTQYGILASRLAGGALGRWTKSGSSGGPLLLSADALKKGANNGKDRIVVGMVVWSPKPKPPKTVAEEQPDLQIGITPIISVDMVEMQKLVREKTYDLITVDEAASQQLPRERCKKSKK